MIDDYCECHCVKRVQIRSSFWSVFPRIWTEYGEIRNKHGAVKLRICWTLFTQCTEYRQSKE